MTLIAVYPWSEGPLVELDESARIEQAARAQAIAVIAHRAQKDKLGDAYRHHPTAVASKFDPVDDTLVYCAAWLHDVLEDTDISADDLALSGIHPEIIQVVQLLTRGPGEGDEYYERIRDDKAARTVKVADLTDNTHPERFDALDPETRSRLRAKYEHAFQVLGEPWPDHWELDQVGGTQFGNPRLYQKPEGDDGDWEDEELSDDDE